jgi:hypothetical protein
MATRYVIDTSSFRVFGNYYPDSFPTFWEHVEELVQHELLVSCSEVRKELEIQSASDHLNDWVAAHPMVFPDPSEPELAFVARIFTVPHFRQLIGEKQRLRGLPVADPFLVAKGGVENCCVVTEEGMKPNAAKIPNVCEHFGVRYMDVRGFLGELGWRF